MNTETISSILALILIIMLFLLVIFIFITFIFENIRKHQFLQQTTEEEKKVLLEYLSIEKNPYKKIEREK